MADYVSLVDYDQGFSESLVDYVQGVTVSELPYSGRTTSESNKPLWSSASTVETINLNHHESTNHKTQGPASDPQPSSRVPLPHVSPSEPLNPRAPLPIWPETETDPVLARARTTIGIGLQGRVIDRVTPGGPAFLSRQLDIGDEILLVDGSALQLPNSIAAALVGDDTEAVVVVTVRKAHSDEVQDVPCFRMDKNTLQRTRQIFETLFQLRRSCGNVDYDDVQDTYSTCDDACSILIQQISVVLQEG